MPQQRKPPSKKAGHSMGAKEAPRLELVAVSSPTIPDPPSGLLKKTGETWRAYWESQVSAAVDRKADGHRIERWIRAVDEYERCSRTFRRHRIVSGSTGQPTLNPLAAYLAKLETSITKAEAELGLTPMARLKLGIAYGEAQMTARELNRQLDKELGREQPDQTPEAWEAEWQEA
jgi:P27 family predicted phage terminase small subunit